MKYVIYLLSTLENYNTKKKADIVHSKEHTMSAIIMKNCINAGRGNAPSMMSDTLA